MDHCRSEALNCGNDPYCAGNILRNHAEKQPYHLFDAARLWHHRCV